MIFGGILNRDKTNFPSGKVIKRYYTMESLILAQDER